jgi:hypothetical protein
VAGNNHRYGIGAVGCTDGADGRGRRDAARDLRVGRRRAGPYHPQRSPHAFLERRSVELDLDCVERIELSGEVLPQARRRSCRVIMRLDRFVWIPSLQQMPHARIVRSEVKKADAILSGGQRQLADRRLESGDSNHDPEGSFYKKLRSTPNNQLPTYVVSGARSGASSARP